MPSFEQIADTGMFWNALEEEEVVKTVLPVKATKEEVVVESADESELEYSTDVPLQRAIFKTLRVSECLYSDMSYMCCRTTNSTKKDAFFQRTEKGVRTPRHGYKWRGPNVFNFFYFLHRVHSTSTK